MVDYILIHCEWTSTLWSLFFALFGLWEVLLSMVKEVLFSWQRFFVVSCSFLFFMDIVAQKEL